MKKLLLAGTVLVLALSPIAALAQDNLNHVEIGAFAEYLRLTQTNPDLNFVGFGGRVGFNVTSYMQIEGEISYDPARSFTNTYSNGVTEDLFKSNVHVLNGLFGPKFQTGSGHFRAFVTGKAGFIDFTANSQNTSNGFSTAVGSVGNGNAKFAIYPAVGVEFFAGPLGLRLEAGDDVYFNNGGQNNLRVTAGPVFRF